MFAYIPARGGSKRIPRKNIRPLAGRPILLRVIDALKKVPGLKGIGVSSDDPEILAMAEAAGARTLGPRDPALADDKTGFADLSKRDAPRYAKEFGSDSCLFVTATAALVRPEHYAEAMALHGREPGGLVMAVTRYEQSPWLALSGDPTASLKPAFPDMYLMPTKDLPSAYTDAGCFYGFSLAALARVESLLDLKPVQGAVLPREVGIDVDTEEDWKRLERSLTERGA
jgi:N-acylneuraminate cytidylyltransferase